MADGAAVPVPPVPPVPPGPTTRRRLLGGVLLAVAACVVAVSTLLAYGLTSEYGYSPNDDPLADLTRAAVTYVVAGLLVAALVAGALELMTRLPLRRRLLWAGGVCLTVLVVLALATALGQRALDERCAGPERTSTGAC